MRTPQVCGGDCIHAAVSESRGAIDKALLGEAEKGREVDRRRKAANEAGGQNRKIGKLSRDVSRLIALVPYWHNHSLLAGGIGEEGPECARLATQGNRE